MLHLSWRGNSERERYSHSLLVVFALSPVSSTVLLHMQIYVFGVPAPDALLIGLVLPLSLHSGRSTQFVQSL